MTLREVERRTESEGTRHYYEKKLGTLVRVIGAETVLSKLDDKLIDSYIDTRTTEGVKQWTISRELGTLRHLLRVAKRRHCWSGDIDALFPVGFGGGYVPRRRALAWEEIRPLLEQLPERWRGWVAFAIATGARRGEVNRAQKEDVSEDFSIVQIRGTKTTLSDDAVAVPAMFRDLLRLACAVETDADPELFGVWGNAVRDLRDACHRAGIAPVTPNDLRRTHATLLRAGGVPIDVVARQLRHADSRMVQKVYGRLTAEQTGKLLPAGPVKVGPIRSVLVRLPVPGMVTVLLWERAA